MISPVYNRNSSRKCLIFNRLFVGACLALFPSINLFAQLTCPDDYTVNLPQNACGVQIYYDSLDWSASVPVSDPVFFPFPGTTIPTGITTATLAVSGPNNQFFTCDFEINVVAFGSTNFVCPSQVNISLEGQCERQVLASDILAFNFNPCDEDYVVEVLDANGDWVPAVLSANDVGYSFNAQVTNFETGHSCQTIINLTGGEPSSITCPPNVVNFCNEPIDPAWVGEPSLTGCFESVELSYEDEMESRFCPDSIGFQVFRTWIAISPNGSQSTCQQLITGMRPPLNQITFPQDMDGSQLPPLNCSGQDVTSATAPSITGWPSIGGHPVTTSSTCKYAVSYLDDVTNICGASYEVKRYWTVVELCTPSTRRDTQTIVLQDIVAPVFMLEDTVFFSLEGTCVDSVLLPSANIVSECSDFNVSIQGLGLSFTTNGAWVSPDTSVGSYPIVYTVTDLCGNASMDSLILHISQETLVACPANDTVSCDYYFSVISPALQIGNYDALAALGLPTFFSNCSFDLTETDSVDVDDCGAGILFREISTIDTANAIQCTQVITIAHLSDFQVLFPKDTSLCVSPAQANLPDPVLSSISCESVSMTFSDMLVQYGVSGCYDVHRKWVAINDCVYDGLADGPDAEISPRKFQDNGDGYMEYIQVIHVNNNSPIVFPDSCDIPDQFVSFDDCTADFIVPSPSVLGCGITSVTVTGSIGGAIGAPVSKLPGMYNATYKAVDDCGKTKTCLATFEVRDTVPPTAQCKQTLVVELMQSGFVEIFASDFDSGSNDNCGNFLEFSFTNEPSDDSRIFNCCDLGSHPLEIWVTDLYGNQSVCQSTLIVESNTGCDCDPAMGGKIETEIGLDIQNVKVKVTSTNGFEPLDWTNITGDFLFQNVPLGGDYTLTPEKDTFPLNGVSTFDMVIIRKHVLGVDTLDSPYKMIAADINNSGEVTTFDMVELRKLILFINTTFPNNKSWRFVPSSFVFPNPLDPWETPFPESIIVEDFSVERLNLNFIGIKIGDVNDNASPNPFDESNTEQK